MGQWEDCLEREMLGGWKHENKNFEGRRKAAALAYSRRPLTGFRAGCTCLALGKLFEGHVRR